MAFLGILYTVSATRLGPVERCIGSSEHLLIGLPITRCGHAKTRSQTDIVAQAGMLEAFEGLPDSVGQLLSSVIGAIPDRDAEFLFWMILPMPAIA